MSGTRKSEQQPISLVIPGKAEYIGLCRLVAGAVGARESLDEEVIADLKLVVTEACTCFLWGPDGSPPSDELGKASGQSSSIRIDFDVMPEAWEITISDPDRKHRVPKGAGGAICEGGLALTIIKALVDSIEQTHSETEGSIVRMVKRLSPRPGYAE
jgi:anti-sigma regulatory factor (Ser/Thr protein kinase)